MTIHCLLCAIDDIDRAVDATFTAPERQELTNIRDALRSALRRRGVFVGDRERTATHNQQTQAMQ